MSKPTPTQGEAERWEVPAIVWTLIIGESGTQKSPPFRTVLKPLYDLQRHAMRTHSEKLEKHNAEVMRYETQVAKWKKKPEGEVRLI